MCLMRVSMAALSPPTPPSINLCCVRLYPETGKAILAGIGCFGPWLKHGAAYLALPEDEDVLTVGLNRAVMLVDTG